MTSLHSKNHTLLIGKETTYGTAVTADKDIGLVQNFNPTGTRTVDLNYGSGSREVQSITAAKFEKKWESEVKLQNGRLFEYIFGNVAHAETTGDWKHTFSVGANLPSFTVEDSFNATSDSVFLYNGSKINSSTLNLDKNDFLKLTCSGISQSVDISPSSASAGIVSDLPILHFKNSTLSTGPAGSETNIGKLQTFSLTIENNLISVDAAGTILTQELVESNFKLSFDFSITFENVDEYQSFLGGTSPQLSPAKRSAVLNVNNGVALGSGRREFYIQLNDLLYEEVGKPVTVGELVVASFKGTATDLGTNGCYFIDNISDTNFS
jgi:hypothetical protein